MVYTQIKLGVLLVLVQQKLYRKGGFVLFSIDLTNGVPIYEQLYKKTVELVIKGVLPEQTQMPSVRSLAKDLGVNPNTVAKAYNQLEHDGVIYSVGGRGSFIAKINHENLKKYAFVDFDKAVNEALDAEVTTEELVERINMLVETREKKGAKK